MNEEYPSAVFSDQKQDQRLKMALSAARMSLWELDLTNEKCIWSGRPTSHFDEFSKTIKNSLNEYFKLIHPDDIAEVIQLIKNAHEGQRFFNQHRAYWPDGTYHWMEGIGMIVKDQGVLKMAGTVQDITEKKLLEAEREDWKIRHELVTKAAGIIVYDYNILTGEIIWSGNVEEVLGFTPEEMGNIDRWVELIHPNDKEEAFKKLERAQKNLEVYEVYYQFRKSDKKYCDIYDRGTFLEQDGRAYRMLGMMSDVTEWRKSQERLSESEKRFKSVINNVNVGVGLWDTTMAPVVYNEAAYELLGMTKDQFDGRVAVDPEWNVVDANGKPMPPENFPIPKAIATLKPVRQVVMGVFRPNMNDRVWLMVDAEPMLDQNENLLNVVCTFADFSD
jgi:PAS domain S-box-containing protein